MDRRRDPTPPTTGLKPVYFSPNVSYVCIVWRMDYTEGFV